jgi:hypothetical protein
MLRVGFHDEHGNRVPMRSHRIGSLERRLLGFLTGGERDLFPVPVRDQPLMFELEYDKTVHVHCRPRDWAIGLPLGAVLLGCRHSDRDQGRIKAKLVPFCG